MKQNSKLKSCGVFFKESVFNMDKTPYWVTLSHDKELVVINSATGNEILRSKVDQIEKIPNSKSIKAIQDNGSIVIRLFSEEETLKNVWVTKNPRFPLCLPSYAQNPPNIVLRAFEEALLQPDTLVLRSMLHHEVIKLRQATEIRKSLFIVFSSAGLSHRFISTCVSYEIADSHMTEQTILRSNSCLTALFKVYYELFSKEFFDNVLFKIIEKIDSVSSINIKTPDEAEKNQILELLNWGLTQFVGGSQYILLNFGIWHLFW